MAQYPIAVVVGSLRKDSINRKLANAVTKLAPARTKQQLVKAAARHLRSVQRRPERIKSYFAHEPVRYAA